MMGIIGMLSYKSVPQAHRTGGSAKEKLKRPAGCNNILLQPELIWNQRLFRQCHQSSKYAKQLLGLTQVVGHWGCRPYYYHLPFGAISLVLSICMALLPHTDFIVACVIFG